jgi:hypothetical protein
LGRFLGALLEQQVQEIKEAVELPLTNPELYEDIGIKPPKVGTVLSPSLLCSAFTLCGARNFTWQTASVYVLVQRKGSTGLSVVCCWAEWWAAPSRRGVL